MDFSKSKISKVAFFVDSLVEGVTTNYFRISNTWCEMISKKYGFTYQNFGRGGACYTSECNKQIPSINEVISCVNLHEFDAIFVGGVLMTGFFMRPLISLKWL